MPGCQVRKPLFGRSFRKLLRGHDGVRPDAGAKQFGVVVVVVIMRALPDAGRRNHVATKNCKDDVSNLRLVKYSMMLKIVEDDEKP